LPPLDQSLVGKLVEGLLTPIKKHPISSLVFFAVSLLAIWMLYRYELIPAALPVGATGLLALVFCVGILLCLHRLTVLRDAPSSLSDPSILGGIRKSFVGREEDSDNLVAQILGSYQVWMNGDSGVGKSSLLQRSVVPRLEEASPVVYINSWRGDWEEAPAQAVLTALNIVASGNNLATLRRALAGRPNLVLILDQFDEYQIEHRAQFIAQSGQLITRGELLAKNPFFAILAEGVRSHRLRCVFVSRNDVEWGKRVVLFDDATEFVLSKLSKEAVEGEIKRIIPDAEIADPEKGWAELREQLCSDLETNGVLPIQMRFAVLGLAELRHELTRAAYFRKGGVQGLVSLYVEREVRRILSDEPVVPVMFQALNLMVTPDGRTTQPIGDSTILKLFAENKRLRAKQALERLAQNDITRRELGNDGNEFWRLDHDYLCGPVREITRRRLPERVALANSYRRYATAPGIWQKTRRLAGPVTLCRFVWAKVFKGLTFDQAYTWVLFSAGFTFGFAALSLFAVGFGWQSYQSEHTGKVLFQHFIPKESSSLEWEIRTGLRELAAKNLQTRAAFLQTVLDSGENSKKIKTNIFMTAVSLSQLRAEDSATLTDDILRPILKRRDLESAQVDVIAGLLKQWGPNGLTSAQANDVADVLFERMPFDRGDSDGKRDWLDAGLSAVKVSVSKQAVKTLTDRIINTGNPEDLLGLAIALEPLKDKVDKETAETWAKALVEKVEAAKNAPGTYSSSFATPCLFVTGAIADKVDDGTIFEREGKAAPSLMEALWRSEGYHVQATYDLAQLAHGLGKIKGRLKPETLEGIAKLLVDKMVMLPPADQSRDHQLEEFAEALGDLGEHVSTESIERGGKVLTDAMRKIPISSEETKLLADGLSRLEGNVGKETGEEWGKLLANMMASTWDADANESIARAMLGLGNKVDSETVERSGKVLIDKMLANPEYGQSKAITRAASTLRLLKGNVSPETAETWGKALADKMEKKSTDAYDVAELASGLDALKEKLSANTIERAAGALKDRMYDDYADKELESGLRLLKDGVRRVTAEQWAKAFSERIDTTTIPMLLESHARILAALRTRIATETYHREARRLAGRLMDLSRSSGALVTELEEGTIEDNELPLLVSALRQKEGTCFVPHWSINLSSGSFAQPKLPPCDEPQWRLLALDAARLSGRPFAYRDETNPSDIVVDLPQLIAWMETQPGDTARKWLPVPTLMSGVLLLCGLTCFGLGWWRSIPLDPVRDGVEEPR
jgi:hypothetical protein